MFYSFKVLHSSDFSTVNFTKTDSSFEQPVETQVGLSQKHLYFTACVVMDNEILAGHMPWPLAIIPFWQAKIIDSQESTETKKGNVDADKMAVLNAWRRVDSRTREALRRSVVSELVEGYEVNLFL